MIRYYAVAQIKMYERRARDGIMDKVSVASYPYNVH